MLSIEGAGQRMQQMALAGAVGADEPEALTEVHLVAEREEQVAHRHLLELHHPPRRVGAAEGDVDLLVGHRRRRRAGGDELLPPRLGRVGLGGVLEVLRGALLHDLHVMEEAPLFVVPALQRVAQQLLATLACLGEGGVRTAVHPAARPFDDDDLGGHPLEQGAVVADHEDGALAGLDLLLQPHTCGDVEVVVGLVEQQHVGAAS